MVIETKELTKFYGRSRGINQVNLQVEAGGVYGFIGPNGAGKSTTICSLLGLINITSGDAYVLGMDVKKNATIFCEGGLSSFRIGILSGHDR